jgi:squalene synthase HpnC
MAPSKPQSFLEPRAFVADADAMGRQWTLEEAEAYTHWLSTHHYENFHVVSFLLPKELHQDFYNVYAFCRWADDLGDEIEDETEALLLLQWWRSLLHTAEADRHPVYVALRGTIARRSLPIKCFDDLVDAFVQDQSVKRYNTWEELLDYCERSANPVGRLVLALCGYHDEERAVLSDFTCSGLQLANFWQDVRVDVDKGRIYIPRQLLQRYNVQEQDILDLRHSPEFEAAMAEAVRYARNLFHQGLPLINKLDARLSLDIELFSRGGLAILDKIEAVNYRVLDARPRIEKNERLWLLIGTLFGWGARRLFGSRG